MDLIGVLLRAILSGPEGQLLAEAEARVMVLDGPDSDERRRFKQCDCPACIIARQFISHRTHVGSVGDGKWSIDCPCHICVSARDGFPKRKMPDPDCPCEFCFEHRRAGGPQIIDMTPIQNQPQDGGGVDTLQRAILGMLGISKEQSEKVMGLMAQKRQAREDDDRVQRALLALPPAAATAEDIKEVEKKFGKKANPMLNAAPQEEIKEMATNNEIIANRQKVDIGGKEPPRFETKGTKITYPEGMSAREAAEWLLKEDMNQEQTVQVNETIDGFPLDAAISLFKALNKEFGWTELEGVPGWFGTTPPDTISVATGVGTFTQVPWGVIRMPGIVNGYIMPCAGHPAKDGHPVLTIHGEVKKKDRQRIANIVQSAREFLRTESIYKGKAIKVSFPEEVLGHGDMIQTQDMPEFYDTSKVDANEVVFAKAVEDQIRVSLFTPIEHTQACRDAKIPLKRTVLFAGTYGVGKTLTAAVTAQKAPLHGWTFVLIESAEELSQAVEFAKQYEPAIIFCEDIDSVMKGERTIDMDGVLNVVDGIESKGRDLMIVLTTNHPEKINKAMLRPGRVDALIEITAPDAHAAQRLIRVYARELLDPGADISAAGELLKGHKPASVREVVEKAKLAAIANNGGPADHISPQDLVTAFHIMKPHFDLMAEKTVVEEVSLDAYFRKMLAEALANSDTALQTGIKTALQPQA